METHREQFMLAAWTAKAQDTAGHSTQIGTIFMEMQIVVCVCVCVCASDADDDLLWNNVNHVHN